MPFFSSFSVLPSILVLTLNCSNSVGESKHKKWILVLLPTKAARGTIAHPEYGHKVKGMQNSHAIKKRAVCL
eukprot:scaffold193738_cov17-Tisochrysis_lutea.AAC.1